MNPVKTILGIVAEYDPFHNGHAYHLSTAVSVVKPDHTYVVLSGFFKQRGQLSLISPYSRAACALQAGADAVFMLPTMWTLRNAENYALGAVSALSSLGCTHIAFGAENTDLSLLRKTADILESPTPEYSDILRSTLAHGNGYPYAVHSALGSVLPEAVNLFSYPNNILAVCYLRAIQRLKVNITPVPIMRKGSYHAEAVYSDFPSASAVRSALLLGNWSSTFSAVPGYSADCIRRTFLDRHYPQMSVINSVMIHSLRSVSKEKARLLPDVSEGLEDRLVSAALLYNRYDKILEACVSKRIPASRVSRIISWAAIGGEYEDPLWNVLPDSLQLLALRKGTDMTKEWKSSSLRIYSSLHDSGNSVSAEYDRKAASLWAICSGLPNDYFYRSKVITL